MALYACLLLYGCVPVSVFVLGTIKFNLKHSFLILLLIMTSLRCGGVSLSNSFTWPPLTIECYIPHCITH